MLSDTNVSEPGVGLAQQEDFISLWRNLLPPDLNLSDIAIVHERPDRRTYRASSSRGPLAVKVCWGDSAWVAQWTARLQPWIVVANPPALIHPPVESAAPDGSRLACMLFEWIEGRHFKFSNSEHLRLLTRSLVQLHSIPCPPGISRGPIIEFLADDPQAPAHPFWILVKRGIRSIGGAIGDADSPALERLTRRARNAIEAICAMDGTPPLIHASLKPEHAIIDRTGQARLIDFDKACFAACELEIADVVSRSLTRAELRERLVHEMNPWASYRPTPFERDYFDLRGGPALKRWKRGRREALIVAAIISFGRGVRVRQRLNGDGPEATSHVSEKTARAVKKLLRTIGA